MKNHWTNKLRLWCIEDGETHWYSASSAEEALEMHLEPLKNPKTGKLDDWNIEDFEVNEVPSDSELPVNMECDEGMVVVIKTASEWALGGKGIVATTCY